MPEVRRAGRRSADAPGVTASSAEGGTPSDGSGVPATGSGCPCAGYWERLIALVERAVYQQTPQALPIEDYLIQVVYGPYEAREAAQVPPETAEVPPEPTPVEAS
jgi:hypothetical protein